MDWDRPIGVALVLIGVAFVVPLLLDPPSAEAGGPAVAWFYGVLLLRGGGGLLLAAIGFTTVAHGQVQLGAVTLTAALVVVATWLAIRFRLFRELSMPVFASLVAVVFVVAVAGAYRSFPR